MRNADPDRNGVLCIGWSRDALALLDLYNSFSTRGHVLPKV
jgi:hypothetical protein